MAGRTISPEKRRAAEQLARNGASLSQITERTGISRGTAQKIRANLKLENVAPPATRGRDVPPAPEASALPPPAPPKLKPDPEPRTRRRRPGKRQATDEELEAMVRKIAKAPAIPAALWLHCDYCANHYRTSAGPLASALVDAAQDDKDLYDILQWLHKSWHRYAWAGLLVSWTGVPLVHHLAPQPIFRVAGPLMGMPPRAGQNGRTAHTHPAPIREDTVIIPADAGGPFAGLDTEQLLKTARAFGLQVPDNMLTDAPAETPPVSGPGPGLQGADEPADAEAAAATADADTDANIP
jgi:transposase-like protein